MSKEAIEEACFSNELIRLSNAFQPLDEFETDLFIYLCAKAKENYKNSEQYLYDKEANAGREWKQDKEINNGWVQVFELDMIEFFEKTNRKKKWSKYNQKERQEFIDKIDKFEEKKFCIFTDEHKKVIWKGSFDNPFYEWEKYRYISELKYNPNEELFTAKMPSNTQKFLCNITTNFTPIALKYLAKLKNKYTKFIYMYVRSLMETEKSNMKGFSMGVDNFKELLQIEEKYGNWYDFKRYILLPAIREINKNTDVFLVGYKAEIEKKLEGRNFKDLSEEVQLKILVDSMCTKGSSGKTIQKIQFHVISKESDIYKKYYAPEEAEQKAS